MRASTAKALHLIAHCCAGLSLLACGTGIYYQKWVEGGLEVIKWVLLSLLVCLVSVVAGMALTIVGLVRAETKRPFKSALLFNTCALVALVAWLVVASRPGMDETAHGVFVTATIHVDEEDLRHRFCGGEFPAPRDDDLGAYVELLSSPDTMREAAEREGVMLDGQPSEDLVRTTLHVEPEPSKRTLVIHVRSWTESDARRLCEGLLDTLQSESRDHCAAEVAVCDAELARFKARHDRYFEEHREQLEPMLEHAASEFAQGIADAISALFGLASSRSSTSSRASIAASPSLDGGPIIATDQRADTGRRDGVTSDTDVIDPILEEYLEIAHPYLVRATAITSACSEIVEVRRGCVLEENSPDLNEMFR